MTYKSYLANVLLFAESARGEWGEGCVGTILCSVGVLKLVE